MMANKEMSFALNIVLRTVVTVNYIKTKAFKFTVYEIRYAIAIFLKEVLNILNQKLHGNYRVKT